MHLVYSFGASSRTTDSTGPCSATEGFFHAGELSVGQYDLRVESPGLSPYVNAAIVISIGSVVQLTVGLAPATVQFWRGLHLSDSRIVSERAARSVHTSVL
jgi:hypothetical protein